jgi:hypothetical protein
MIDIERQCVEQALILKSSLAQRQLADLRKNGIPFEHPLSGATSQIEWEMESRKRIIQILLVPPVITLNIFVFLLTYPIAYMINIWSTYKIKRELKQMIKLCNLNCISTQSPNIKRLEYLWGLHGLDESYTHNECIDLLSVWIKILYGADIASNINIRQKIDTICAKRVELNRPYYENRMEGTHFHFAPVLPSVITLISNELPEYAQKST